MRRQQGRDPQAPSEVIQRQVDELDAAVRQLKSPGATTVQTVDPLEDSDNAYLSQAQGEIANPHVDVGKLRAKDLVVYHEDEWWRVGSGGKFEIIVTDPIGDPVIAQDYGSLLLVPYDLNGSRLRHAAAGLATVGGATIQYFNSTQAVNMLSTPITIGAGAHTSYTDATTSTGVIDEGANLVNTGDLINIVVTASGGGLGLIVVLHFA